MKKKIIIACLILLFLITSISFAADQQNNLTADQNDDDLNVADDSQNPLDANPINIKIEKKWVDNDNEKGLRPDNLTFHLEANGVELAPVFVLNSTDGWKYTFEYSSSDSLPDDVELVEENVPDGYECNITGDLKNGFVVTNTLKKNDTDSTPQDNPTKGSTDSAKQDNPTKSDSNPTQQDNPTNDGADSTQNTPTKSSTDSAKQDDTSQNPQDIPKKDDSVNATQNVPEPKKPEPPLEHPETGYPIILLVVAAVGLIVAYKLRKKE